MKRFAILFSCITAALVGTFFASKQLKTVETNAITQDGTPVTVSYVKNGTSTEDPYKGWVAFKGTTAQGWGTPMFEVTPQGGSIRTAYCLSPNVQAPTEGTSYNKDGVTFPYKVASFPVNEKTNQIKLALYIINAPDSDTTAKAIRLQWKWDNPDSINPEWENIINPYSAQYGKRNYQYILMHVLIGSIYGEVELPSLGEAEQAWYNRVSSQLSRLVSENSEVWQRASTHQLFGLDTSVYPQTPAIQNIVWLEPYTINTSASDAVDGDAYVEASDKAQIVDSINFCAQVGVNYTLQGTLMDKSTGEPLEIDGKTITKTISVTPTQECSTVNMTFDLDASNIAGKQIVAFQSLISSNGTTLVSHNDINDPAQTITIVSLGTVASGVSKDSKKILAAEGATITDHIKYCLAAGTEYTIIGTLMNKATGEPISINGEPITQTMTVTSQTNCEEADMKFTFDATGMGGTEIVVFETAGVISTIDNKFTPIVSHEDINDAAQTIMVELPKPADTGRMTSDGDSGININNGVAIAITATVSSVVVYLVARFTAKKKFYGKR